MRARYSVFGLLFVMLCLFNTAGRAQCWNGPGESVKLQSFGDDGIFLLDDGRQVVLAGLERPLSPPAIIGWREVSSKISSKPVTLYVDGPYAEDRYGRLQVFVATADGALLQNRVIENGWARVYPTGEGHACIAVLLVAEARARAHHLGIWSDPAYRLRDAVDTKGLLALNGTYQIVIGKVLALARKSGRLYLNFGEDWKTDFTVTAARPDVRLFDGPMFDVGDGKEAGIVGKRVRVRGFLGRYNGPNMEITSPDQIEILDD